MRKMIVFLVGSTVSFNTYSQKVADTIKPKQLKEVVIKAWQRKDISHMADEHNGFLTVGKKSEVVTLSSTNANIAIKTGRQLFSKVPGVFVYDMDGSGNQLNISTRGLDPHRSWEYNIRQNGVTINSDMYGYPASHYSAPMESFERIEMVRGTGSLQYGAQFGGMLNFITKKPDSTKLAGFESTNTIGSFGLVSTYNAISGTKGKFSYYGYYHRRHSNGYRKNSESDAESQFIQLNYRFSPQASFKVELGRSKYIYQIPGPLNDSMFIANPQMSTRSRNYFSPDIYVPSMQFEYNFSLRTKISISASGVFGTRNSVQFDAFANVPDSIDQAAGAYKNRQVDIDRFNSKTVETRLLHEYTIGKMISKLTSGVVYMNNDLHRRQLGKGTTGNDYDLTLVEPAFGRDLHFRTNNIAVFAENAFQLNSKWAISPGIRLENGISRMSGMINYYPANNLPNSIKHHFSLLGISSQYTINQNNTVYGGISQAYRPVIFKDIVPASTYEQVNNNLKDAFGYNAEFGSRGILFRRFQYDVSLFRVAYKNRLGTLVLQDNAGQPYTFKTNIGNSVTNGIEIFMQYKFPLSNNLFAGIFTSTAYMDAKYTSGEVSTGTNNKSIKGNRVEAVPKWISRNGIDLIYQGFSMTVLYSYTSNSYSDALNTITPPASGARGLTPSYGLWDMNASLRTGTIFTFRAGINNISNKQYFTKRPTFYPGPGIWPSDGRNVYLTVSFKI